MSHIDILSTQVIKVTGNVDTEVRWGDRDIFPKKLKLRMTGYKPEAEFRVSQG